MKAILSQLISRDLWNNDHEERDLFLDNRKSWDFLGTPLVIRPLQSMTGILPVTDV